MIDTFKPMGLDLAKDLHGHVRVELRDRWTGRVVDSQEKDNLVTDAAQQMLLTSIGCYSGTGPSPLQLWLPIYEKLLGGILLFDNTLTESASNTHFPSSAKLVAYAGQISDSTNATAGSYNEQESVFTSNGFTTVWDFLTSQANGTIASLARTSSHFAVAPAYYPTVDGNITTGRPTAHTIMNPSWLGYDETNHYLYFAPTGSQTVDGVTYPNNCIYRITIDLSKIGLVGCMPPASQATLVKTLSSSDGSALAYQFTYDKYENNFVYITGNTIHLVATDGTHTTKSVSGTSGTGFAVTENYYWRDSGTTLYRITKANIADVNSYAKVSSLGLVPGDGDVIFMPITGGNSSTQILYTDGTIFETTLSYLQGSRSCRQVGPYYCPSNTTSYAYNMYPNSHYLGTIANLDSPVTKSSSQTMKVIYTLTEA